MSEDHGKQMVAATTSSDKSPTVPSISTSLGGKDALNTEAVGGIDHANNNAPKQTYAQGWKLWVVYIATLLTMFLVGRKSRVVRGIVINADNVPVDGQVPLDMTIVATAIPKITEEFQSLDEVGWYSSAFFLTLAVFQSPWGKIYKYHSTKISYVASVVIFEIGSLICGVAQNSQMLIAGRVITGCGGAGVTIGTYVIISHLVPPSRAPAFIGGIGAAFSIASVAGPLIGGAFTGEVSWRFCFYINLPIGGVATLVFFALYPTPTTKPPQESIRERFLQLDLLGTGLAVASVVCYFLALEWGGISKAWVDADVVGTLVGSFLLTIAFGVVQWALGQRASIIPRILVQRHVAGGSAFMFLLSCANFSMIYNLPLYFQSVKGSSPTLSGIQVLPLIVSASVFVVLSGLLFTRFRFYQIYLLVGASFTTIGAGLLYTLEVDSYAGKYIGFQFVVGFGNGVCQQIPLTVVQAFSKPDDLATSMSTVLFFQLLSGALSVAAAQSLLLNRLLSTASKRLPGVSSAKIISTGATNLDRVFSGGDLAAIRYSYLDGLRAAWAMAIAFAGVALLTGLTLGFRRIEQPPHGGQAINKPNQEASHSKEREEQGV